MAQGGRRSRRRQATMFKCKQFKFNAGAAGLFGRRIRRQHGPQLVRRQRRRLVGRFSFRRLLLRRLARRRRRRLIILQHGGEASQGHGLRRIRCLRGRTLLGCSGALGRLPVRRRF